MKVFLVGVPRRSLREAPVTRTSRASTSVISLVLINKFSRCFAPAFLIRRVYALYTGRIPRPSFFSHSLFLSLSSLSHRLPEVAFLILRVLDELDVDFSRDETSSRQAVSRYDLLMFNVKRLGERKGRRRRKRRTEKEWRNEISNSGREFRRAKSAGIFTRGARASHNVPTQSGRD